MGVGIDVGFYGDLNKLNLNILAIHNHKLINDVVTAYKVLCKILNSSTKY